MSNYFKACNLVIKVGNFKLGNDTLIFNLSSAIDCISKKLGLCKVVNVCYALRDEIQYPLVKPYRDKQGEYFNNTSLQVIKKDFNNLLFNSRSKILKNIKFLRFNESGDFKDKKQINKACSLSKFLYDKFKIVTYFYTCREDLIFPDKPYFLVKGSNCNMPNGTTKVFACKEDVPSSFTICPTTCDKCMLCKKPNKKDVAFIVHGPRNFLKSKFKAY
jgi:hypothetical protein